MELQDKLYSSTEVAEILGVSLRSIYRYLDEGKLDAAVKTVTGRHRFSKQNILDFLYPDGKSEAVMPVMSVEEEVSKKIKNPKVSTEAKVTTKPIASAKVESVEENTLPVKEEKPQTVDWLAKFKALQEERLKAKTATNSTMPKNEDKVQTEVETVQTTTTTPVNPMPINEVSVEPSPNTTISSGQPAIQQPASVSEEPQVDWLAKFKAAREELLKNQQQRELEASNVTSTSNEPASVAEPAASVYRPVVNQAPVAQIVNTPPVVPSQSVQTSIVTPKANTEGFFYYTSGIKGLKEIAHGLNNLAKNSNVNYSFTMYAGMSLYKTIKPFSIIHSYVKAQDREVFERALQLSPTERDQAQVCLIATNDAMVFETSKDLHGLKVVSLVKLKQDLLEAGEDDLAGELDLLQR